MKPIVIVLLLCFLFRGQAAAQSPWTRGKAGFYLEASWQTTPRYDVVFDKSSENNRRTLQREITENTFQFFAEYGISHKTTVWLAAPYRFLNAGSETNAGPATLDAGSLGGFGNLSLACRHNFLSQKLALTGQVRVDLPDGHRNLNTGLITGFQQGTLSMLLSLGERTRSRYWFIYGGSGIRGAWTSPLILGGGEAALKIRRYWLVLYSNLSWNMGPDNLSSWNAQKNTSLFLPGQSFWNVGAKAIIPFDRFFGGVISVSAPLTGDLFPRQPALAAALYFKWD
jgi:hypothetical protein